VQNKFSQRYSFWDGFTSLVGEGIHPGRRIIFVAEILPGEATSLFWRRKSFSREETHGF
jgi:hypothetical protein